MRKNILFVILVLFVSFSSRGDDYHNISGFIGERAAGLGGAYSAISDDPSGGYYNPAGIAFAYDNFISISANTYNSSIKRYQNIFGPGQDYLRKSAGIAPNFIGTVKAFGNFKVGFSLISPNTEIYDQADQFLYPWTRSNLASFRIDYTEDTRAFTLGPSLAYTLSPKLSVGASLFVSKETARIISSQISETVSDGYSHSVTQDRRYTTSILPILGIQYMPKPKIALGLSFKRNFVVGKKRSITSFSSSSATSTFSDTGILQSSNDMSAQVVENFIFVGPPESGEVPQVNEIRTGIAYFASPKFLMSFDVIYTSGYSKTLDRNRYELTTGTIFLRDSEDTSLYRKSTVNFAFGLEYYLTETLAFRIGSYTNYANSKNINWLDTAVNTYLSEQNLTTFVISNNLLYQPESLQPKSRFEHVDTFGYSMGLSWTTAKTSITLSYVREQGNGGSQIDTSQPAQTMSIRNYSIYLVASSHN